MCAGGHCLEVVQLHWATHRYHTNLSTFLDAYAATECRLKRAERPFNHEAMDVVWCVILNKALLFSDWRSQIRYLRATFCNYSNWTDVEP